MVTLYSTHCPRCEVLKKKLTAVNVEFTEVDDIDKMQEMGIQTAPMLEVEGELMDFSQAIAWVRNKE